MMRVGVISDTHGVSFGITRALRAIPDAEAWIPNKGKGACDEQLSKKRTIYC